MAERAGDRGAVRAADRDAEPPAGELLSLYRTMRRIRSFEERVTHEFKLGQIHGFVHTSLGQEGVAAGAAAALEPDDLITTTHRGHGHCLAKGADPSRMMAELFGRVDGLCGGRGGSMHLADPRLGILGANGIVGAGIPIAAGAALASAVTGTGRVAAAFFGEGAVHCGAFHEGLVLAVAWKLPLVLVCENNGWAEFTAGSAWGGPGPAERAASYGMPASTVDGADPIAVRDAIAAAAAHARRGDGPAMVEAQAARLGGHFEGDAQGYRPAVDLEGAQKRDPLARARLRLTAVAAQVEEIDVAADAEMDLAVATAKASPFPSPDDVLRYVEADPPSSGVAPGRARRSRPHAGEGPSYLDSLREALGDELARDPSVIVLGVDVGAGGGVYTVTAGLRARFDERRVRDTPIAEAGVLGAAVGAAMAGLRPVVEIMYMDFLTVCLDPIVNQAAKLRYMTGGAVTVPIVFRTQTGGGRSAGAQHSQSLEGLLAHIPGLRVFCPADARDAYDLLVAAVRDDGPVCFVENRRLYNRRDPAWERDPLPPGVARVVRAGDELTIVSWGRMVGETLRALECVEGPGARAEVIDLRTLVPLDADTVAASVRRTGRCLVVHEAVERFGPGAELVARIAEDALYDLDGPIERLGAAPTPTPYSPALESAALPARERIAVRIAAVARA